MFSVKLVNSDSLLQKAFAIREEVFIVEQEVARDEEFDEFESNSFHFVALDEKELPIGASRWRRTENGIKLERFAVKKDWRGKGVGSALVKETLDHIQKEAEQGTKLYLHAQLDAIPLYEKFGFEKKGDMFEECSILHYLMQKSL